MADLRRWAVAGVVALALGVGGCASRKGRAPASPPAPSPRPAAEPRPPAGAAPGLSIPQPVDGRFTTVNSGIGGEEAVWHLRAALNVAALACRDQPTILPAYNAFLKSRKAVLARAYAAEQRRHGATALDQHMTRLYNFFAQPPAAAGFCKAAAIEAPRVAALPAAGVTQEAPAALARLEAPVIAFYDAYHRYRLALAEWRANPRASTRLADAAPPPSPGPAKLAGGGWRVQIGAFTGRAAAEAAWAKARKAVPTLGQYAVRYEAARDRGLVRVQLGPASDREDAIRLCAAAAAGGFDCLPLRGDGNAR